MNPGARVGLVRDIKPAGQVVHELAQEATNVQALSPLHEVRTAAPPRSGNGLAKT
jgi:hypothetical protein